MTYGLYVTRRCVASRSFMTDPTAACTCRNPTRSHYVDHKYTAVAEDVTESAPYVRCLPLGDRGVEMHLLLATNGSRVCFRT